MRDKKRQGLQGLQDLKYLLTVSKMTLPVKVAALLRFTVLQFAFELFEFQGRCFALRFAFTRASLLPTIDEVAEIRHIVTSIHHDVICRK